MSNEKEVEARIQDLARPVENIFLIEHHDGLERAPYYRASDIFVLPGVLEGEPSVLCEAMACGLPVAASRIAGHLNLVREGRTGLLFAPDNERNMASCLRRLVQDDALRRRLGKSARRLVARERDIRVVAQRFVQAVTSAS